MVTEAAAVVAAEAVVAADPGNGGEGPEHHLGDLETDAEEAEGPEALGPDGVGGAEEDHGYEG